jgi:phosphate/sulfate permease
VGSGALTLRKALVVAAIFEFLGALSLGSRVAGTVSKGIADPACFEGEGGLLMVGMLSALASAGVWLIVASVFGLPVSTTHSIGTVYPEYVFSYFSTLGFSGLTGLVAPQWAPLLEWE